MILILHGLPSWSRMFEPCPPGFEIVTTLWRPTTLASGTATGGLQRKAGWSRLAPTRLLRRMNIVVESAPTGRSSPAQDGSSKRISRCRIHRSGQQPHDSEHACSRAGSCRLQDLQRLLVLRRPTLQDLRQDLHAVTRKCRPDWDITRPNSKVGASKTARSSSIRTSKHKSRLSVNRIRARTF
jgi:hypothetical protein